MRLDQLPRSDQVEDRREDRRDGGFRIGRAGGIGIGTIILLGLVGWALGINPLYLIGGAEILSRLGGSQQQSQPVPSPSQTAELPSDQMGEFVSAVLGSTEVEWKEIFTREDIRKADLGHVFWRDPLGLRVRPIRDGPVLLSARPEGLS
jgi:predicted metalloprotease